jgi:MoCo/4Fe-4S cofactor protein with predicted Tat translocation signal
MSQEKKFWKGLEELADTEVAQKMRENEFSEDLPNADFLGDEDKLENSSTTRRDFLKYVGFSTAAATLASCEAPVTKSIPYVNAPEEIIPGIANYYATSYFDGNDYASVLIKTREGRPIFIEPNKMAKVNGHANSRIQASVLNLYDSTRLQAPLVDGASSDWDTLDNGVKKALKDAEAAGKQVVILSSSIISPATKKLAGEFGAAYSNFRHVSYDAFSYSGKLDAWQEATGKRAVPKVCLKKADVVVGFNTDFLSDYMGQQLAGEYASRRKPGKDMSRHFQFESSLTNTGASADKRYKIAPSQVGPAMIALHNEITGGSLPGAISGMDKQIKQVAKELKAAGENGVVLCGGNDKDLEAICIAINKSLGNFATTLRPDMSSNLRQGDDKAMKQLMVDMAAGKVGALLVYNLNPAYLKAGDEKFMAALEKVPAVVYFSQKADETAKYAKYVCAEHSYLESWGDAEPIKGHFSIQQPCIRPLFNTRQFEECLMAWAGIDGSYHDYLKASWSDMAVDWNTFVHDGVTHKPVAMTFLMDEAEQEEGDEEESATQTVDLNAAARSVSSSKTSGYDLMFYQMAGMGVGTLANNPWLLEFPDPISRISWDNYLCISASDAMELGLENWSSSNGALNGSYVNLKANGRTLSNVPVLIQPGQAPKTVSLAVGWGRQGAGKAADGVGVNAFALMNGAHNTSVEIEKADGEHGFASIQLAHTMMGRKIVNETSLESFLNEPPSNESGTGWNQEIKLETYKGPLSPEKTNLWDDFDHEMGHMWNMSIDLNLCNGCGACVVACHSENNVPVVGKEEVRKHRDMHWLRIDRYYSSDMTEEVANEEDMSGIAMYAKMEEAGEDPEVHFQPVMCQHCNHAPCETVCPVIATSHSAEGLNHMTYNRCIGTRYCANNCPYKVRRFNWFQYHDGSQDEFNVNYAFNDDLGRMVLNPDVTVRSRGVMEKCSMCIQRIQLGKLEAKKSGEKLKDGSVQTACMSACPTGAIVFGDVNDKESEVYKLKQDKRMYHLLEEVGTQPSVFYQTKVKHRA